MQSTTSELCIFCMIIMITMKTRPADTAFTLRVISTAVKLTHKSMYDGHASQLYKKEDNVQFTKTERNINCSTEHNQLNTSLLHCHS